MSDKIQAAKVKAKSKRAKVAAAPVRALPSKVLFVSSNPEITAFPITVVGEEIRPRLVERFAMHEFVVQGRITRAEED
jgi:hypothetical protein